MPLMIFSNIFTFLFSFAYFYSQVTSTDITFPSGRAGGGVFSIYTGTLLVLCGVGDGADRVEEGGNQVPAQRALPGRAGICQPSHVTSGSGKSIFSKNEKVERIMRYNM